MIWTYATVLELLEERWRRRFWLLVVLMIITGVLDLVGVAMIVPFLAVLSEPATVERQPVLSLVYDTLGFASTESFLQFLGLATFVFVVSGIAARAVAFYLTNLFARQVNISFGMARLRRYLSQPYEWFLEQHSADLSKSVLQEINEIVNSSILPSFRLISNTVLLLLLSGLLLAIEPIGAILIGTVFGVAFWLVDLGSRRRIAEMGHERRRANRERHQATGEALSGIKEVKVMGLENSYLTRYFDPSLRLAGYQARISLIGEMPRFALEAMTFGGMLLFTLWLLWTNDSALDQVVPVLGAFAFAALRLMPTSQALFRDVSLLRFGRPALEALREELERLPIEKEYDGAMTLREEVSLEEVSYGYPVSDRTALEEISLDIPVGASLGVMGATGAGKSTLIDLMLGLVTPTAGRFAVDGETLGPHNRRAWQRCIGYVPQSIHLVDDSIAANIAFGEDRRDIDMDRVRRVAGIARIHDFVESLPEGYETFAGDSGLRLSGGQRQRLGIARALYQDRDMLIFDEATSALDPVTEREVMSGLLSLKGEKTMIFVSHRPNTLSMCDTVLILKQGRVAARDTPARLRENSPEFREMVASNG